MIYHWGLQQGSDEWHAIRLGKMTASNAQAIMALGKGLDTYCLEVASEIMTGKKEDGYSNANMERGVELENQAVFAYEMKTGYVAKKCGFIEYDAFCGASPDGLIDDAGGVEIKNHTAKVMTELLIRGKPDAKYLRQMDMNLYCSGREWWDYVGYNEHFEEPFVYRHTLTPENKETLEKGLEYGRKKITEIITELKEKGYKTKLHF